MAMTFFSYMKYSVAVKQDQMHFDKQKKKDQNFFLTFESRKKTLIFAPDNHL